MADRLIVMNAGNAEQVDTPMVVYRRPASLFVAGFIGSPAMNFLAADVATDGATASLAGGARLRLPGVVPRLAGRRVTLGIRPEHLHPADADAAAFRLQVQLVETLGADSLAHGILTGNGDGLTVRLPGGVNLHEGDSLSLAVDPGELHFFDPETGLRLADL